MKVKYNAVILTKKSSKELSKVCSALIINGRIYHHSSAEYSEILLSTEENKRNENKAIPSHKMYGICIPLEVRHGMDAVRFFHVPLFLSPSFSPQPRCFSLAIKIEYDNYPWEEDNQIMLLTRKE